MTNELAVAIAHRRPADFGDRIALGFTKTMRFFADAFFGDRHGHRAIVIETVAAVPGMVGATLTHLKCLRRMEGDRGRIRTLMEEAENERMHLMTFINIAQPTMLERLLIIMVQAGFYAAFFVLYLIAPQVAHRVVGYFEEEAVISYTHYLQAIDEGRIDNVAAPAIALHYWMMPANSRLRDVVLKVRADEAHHRDANHAFADELAGRDTAGDIAPYPEHAVEIRHAA